MAMPWLHQQSQIDVIMALAGLPHQHASNDDGLNIATLVENTNPDMAMAGSPTWTSLAILLTTANYQSAHSHWLWLHPNINIVEGEDIPSNIH